MSSTLVAHIKSEVKRLPRDRCVEIRGDELWMICPFHFARNGRAERTGSMKVNIDPRSKHCGKIWCFGCKAKGPWNRLAEKLNLKQIDGELYEEKVQGVVTDEITERLFSFDNEEMKLSLSDSVPWPVDMEWRTIPGKLVNRVGGLMRADRRGEPYLYLPAYVYGEVPGGIRCSVVRTKDQKPYINDKGIWSKSALFPYDYVRARNPTNVFLVEGPRDALNMIRHGLPALSCIGSYWTEDKTDLVLGLNPKRIITAFDPDAAGDTATEGAREFFAPHGYKLLRLEFDIDHDPADITSDDAVEIKKWLKDQKKGSR
jgi:hypothetical protein